MTGEVGAGFFGGFAVLAGEDGDGVVRGRSVLHGEANGGAHLAGGASADRVDDKDGCSGLGERGVDFGCGAGFLEACAGELLAHRNQHNLWVHGPSVGKAYIEA